MSKLFRVGLLAVVLGGAAALAAAPAGDGFAPIAAEYEALRATLAADETKGVAEGAAKLGKLAAAPLTPAQAGVPESAAQELAQLLPKIAAASAKVAAAQGLEAVRDAFGELSAPIVRWFELRSDKGDWAIAYCPMADKHWLQKKTPEVSNPFYGSEMLTCGRFVEKVES